MGGTQAGSSFPRAVVRALAHCEVHVYLHAAKSGSQHAPKMPAAARLNHVRHPASHQHCLCQRGFSQQRLSRRPQACMPIKQTKGRGILT